MDIKIEIKEEDSVSDDVASQSEKEYFREVVSVKSDAVLLDDDCDVTNKTKIISETPFTKHPVKQIKNETATCSNNWEMDRKTKFEELILVSDLGPQNEGEFLPEDPVMTDNYNSGHEMDNKIEIKEEHWLLKTESTFVCDEFEEIAWEQFNSQTAKQRTSLELKKKYRSLKMKARQANANRKKVLYATGGGKTPLPADNYLNSLMGSRSSGLQSISDCHLIDEATGVVSALPDGSAWDIPSTSTSEPAERELVGTEPELSAVAQERNQLTTSPSIYSTNVLSWAKERKEVEVLRQQLLRKEIEDRKRRADEIYKAKIRLIKQKSILLDLQIKLAEKQLKK